MYNIVLLEALFAFIYLLMKKFAMFVWDHDKSKFYLIRNWYHWFEYTYVFTCAVLAPQHTANQGLMTLIIVILVKVIFERSKFLDSYFEKKLKDKT